MSELISCSGEAKPVFAVGSVVAAVPVDGAVPAGSVWKLSLRVDGCSEKRVGAPRSGQFYMLKSKKSGQFLGRPISVYHCVLENDVLSLEFLILKKGKGTEELCALSAHDEVEILGPVGTFWPDVPNGARIALVGGGVGIAPIAGFAATLPECSYDFYAAFKSGSYGLEYVRARNCVITTDDGSVGIKGMITAAFSAETVGAYDVVYACGPTPMLAYIQSICREAGVACFLSLEQRMACGLGACLGCTITTSEGNKRVCKDGPVFNGAILDFAPPVRAEKNAPLSESELPDMSVNIAGVRFSNPVIAASGTFGYGTEYASIFDVGVLGGICSKGLTLEVKPGNSGVRIVETPSGLINSIGLENPGIEHFINHELPAMQKLGPVAIANLSGSSVEGYVRGAELLDKTDVPMIELNISCPNVKAGGMAFGMDCDAAGSVTRAVRAATKKPLMVKLSPNAPDIIGIAMAVRGAGADAVSLVNTFQATAIDIETGRPVFANVRAGFSGPAVKPIALRIVYDVVQAMNKLPPEERIPVVGLGGIHSWQDAVEFIMAGAAAVEVGAATFSNPNTMKDIIEGISAFMKRKGYRTIDDFRGCAQ